MNPLSISINHFVKIAGEKNITYMDDMLITTINNENITPAEFSIFGNPCRLNAFFFAVCTQGSVSVRIDLDEFTVKEGMVIINTPQRIIQFINEKDVNIICIGFSPDFINKMAVKADLISLNIIFNKFPILNLNREDIKSAINFFSIIEYYAKFRSTHSSKIIAHLLSSLSYWFIDILNERKGDIIKNENISNSRESLLNDFFSLVSKHHNKEHFIDFYADKLNITPKYLSKIVKEASGKSASEWINDYIILESKSLIKFSGMSIKEIAYNLNFPNASFFSQYFKRHVGMKPKEYRLL